MKVLSLLMPGPCRSCPEFESHWGAVGFLPGGRAPHLGLTNWVMPFAQHSVLFVGWLTDSCALFALAYPACGGSPILGPLSMETKPNRSWRGGDYFPELGPQISLWSFSDPCTLPVVWLSLPSCCLLAWEL